MNTLPPLQPRSTVSRRWWLLIPFILVVAVLFLVSFACYSLPGFLHVGRDAAALRDGLLKTASREFTPVVEANLGPVTFWAVRTGLGFAPLEPEARMALRAVRAAEVSYSQRRHPGGKLDQATMLADADKAMTARGWERIVGVREGDDLVAVYVPKNLRSPHDVRFCVAVVGAEELVVAAGRSNLEPLMDLASRHGDWHQFAQLSLPR
jgi:hypothetical protein